HLASGSVSADYFAAGVFSDGHADGKDLHDGFEFRHSLLELRVQAPQFFAAFGHAILEFAIELLQLASFAMQLGEDADLGAQDLRDDRDRDVVDCAALIAANTVYFREMDGGDEDDGNLLEARMLTHHIGQLEAVDFGHGNIHQYD